MAPLARYLLVFGGFAGVVGLTLYPIYFYPLTHLGDYKKAQTINRAGIIQEDVQPPDSSVPQLSSLYLMLISQNS